MRIYRPHSRPVYAPGAVGRTVVQMPKLVMTDLWRRSRIDPRVWPELQFAQAWADELFLDPGDCYPERLLDKDLFLLAAHMPPTFSSAMLRRRLLRGVSLRRMAERGGEPVA